MKGFAFLALAIILISAILFSGCSKSVEPTSSAPVTSAPQTTSASANTPVSAPPTTASASSPTDQSPQTGGTLRMLWRLADGNPGWPPEYIGEIICTGQIFYETLLRGNNKGEYLPWLATSFDLASDLKSLTFTLRKGVKFHDGTDFNAQAVKWNIQMQKDQRKRFPYVDSMDVLDDYTIRLNLTSWNNSKLDDFTNGYTMMASPTAYEKNGIEWMRVHPVGTGPFIFESFIPGVGCSGVRNPDYWDAPKPYVDAIEMKFVTDALARKSAMQANEADVTLMELGKNAADLMNLGFVGINPVTAQYTLFPSSKDPNSPFHDQKVREAIEYAIDREAIASGLGNGLWQAPYQIVARGTVSFDPNFVGRKYDPDKAKALMKEAGYEKGFTTTLYPPPAANKDVDMAIQNYLSKINIKLNIEYLDYSKYSQFMNGATWDGLVICELPSEGNWNNWLNVFFGGDVPFYVSKLVTPEFQAALTESVNAPMLNVDLMKKVNKVIYDQCLYIPVYEAGMGYSLKSNIHDGGFGQRQNAMFWNPETIWISK